jgi:hypothetical protein
MGVFEYRQAEEIRDAFARHGARYLFIGKSGAILLGFPDTTQDADLFVEKSPDNGRAIVAALRARQGFRAAQERALRPRPGFRARRHRALRRRLAAALLAQKGRERLTSCGSDPHAEPSSEDAAYDVPRTTSIPVGISR